MEASTDFFINLIQNNRILYDKSLKEFRNNKRKEEAWQNVATESRMDVDAAKKRYASLRQKYSREKRNAEIRRRNKISTETCWVHYHRLHFLNSFVQPRSSYTNDIMFEGNDDDQTNAARPNVEIELDPGIDINELSELCGDVGNTHSGLKECQHLQGTEILQSHRDNIIEQQNDDDEALNNNNDETMITEEIISSYSGVPSIIHYSASQNVERDDPARNNEVEMGTEEQLDESFDIDNYMSTYPGTSSSQSTNPLIIRQASTSDKNSLLPKGLMNKKPQNSMYKHSLLQQQFSSRNNLSAPTIGKKSAVRQDRVQSMEPIVPSTTSSTLQTATSRPSRANVPTTQQTASSRGNVPTSTEFNDKRFEAIRNKMDACLTAITNRANDKGQRSPHAPFLAYLGTKLPNVPRDMLPALEKEILNLVDRHPVKDF